MKSVSAAQDFCGKPIPARDPEGWTVGGVSLPLHDPTKVLQIGVFIYPFSWTEVYVHI